MNCADDKNRMLPLRFLWNPLPLETDGDEPRPPHGSSPFVRSRDLYLTLLVAVDRAQQRIEFLSRQAAAHAKGDGVKVDGSGS